MVIRGLIAHLGYPTGGFKAPMIYNPWFADSRWMSKWVPTGVKPEDAGDLGSGAILK